MLWDWFLVFFVCSLSWHEQTQFCGVNAQIVARLFRLVLSGKGQLIGSRSFVWICDGMVKGGRLFPDPPSTNNHDDDDPGAH